MSEFVELQDREVPPQLIVVREEHIKNYTLKFITFNEGDSIWLFRDGELRGVFSWTGMIQFNEFKQFICYFPDPVDGLLFGQWEPEATATDADYAMVISRIQQSFYSVGKRNRLEGVILQGVLTCTLDDELEEAVLAVDDIPFVTFLSKDGGIKLIATDCSEWEATVEFDHLANDANSGFLPEMAEAVYEHLIMQLPDEGCVIH